MLIKASRQPLSGRDRMAFDFPLPLGNSAFLLPTQAVILALSLLVIVMLGMEMFK